MTYNKWQMMYSILYKAYCIEHMAYDIWQVVCGMWYKAYDIKIWHTVYIIQIQAYGIQLMTYCIQCMA